MSNADERKIINFLLGQDEYCGVWFGDENPFMTGNFWWRTPLRDFVQKQDAEIAELKRQLSYYTDKNQNQ